MMRVYGQQLTLTKKELKKLVAPSESHMDDIVLIIYENDTWIPSESTELRMKFIVTSHTSSIGHRGANATKTIIKEDFF